FTPRYVGQGVAMRKKTKTGFESIEFVFGTTEGGYRLLPYFDGHTVIDSYSWRNWGDVAATAGQAWNDFAKATQSSWKSGATNTTEPSARGLPSIQLTAGTSWSCSSALQRRPQHRNCSTKSVPPVARLSGCRSWPRSRMTLRE